MSPPSVLDPRGRRPLSPPDRRLCVPALAKQTIAREQKQSKVEAVKLHKYVSILDVFVYTVQYIFLTENKYFYTLNFVMYLTSQK